MRNVAKTSSDKLIADTSQLNEDFIKSSNEKGDGGYFLEVDVQYTKQLHKLHNEMKIE